MRFLKCVFIGYLLILLFLEEPGICYANAEPADKLENVAVVLVIDTSGSMEKTDPQNLRGTAANIFIDLLSPQDYIGIITFHTSVDTVLPMDMVGSKENRNAIKNKLIPKLVSAGDTNYQLALSEAKRQLDGLKEKDIRKVIVFITDGTPDPDPKRANDKTFMANYMNSLWSMVSDISLNNYPVYSVGFGKDINPQLLQKMSLETKGDYLGINDSAELASSFFKILSNLKNRNIFLNSEFEVMKEKEFGFDFDQYTSQITFVFTYPENQPMDISLVQEEKITKSDIAVNKTDRYMIVTLNQNKMRLEGKWLISVKGDGMLKSFGAKDLFVKSWIKSPDPYSIHSVNDPIEIEAIVTGGETDRLHVEAQINKNGINEVFPIILKYDNGIYRGVYEEADQAGTYNIEVKVIQAGKMITKSDSKVFVKVIPSLETDFHANNKIFLKGSGSVITSWLSINNNLIKPSVDLSIENYQIIFHYQDGKKENAVLYDNGNIKNGDVRSKDGIYSTKFEFNNIGKINAELAVKGVYKGENFVLNKNISFFEVSLPGTVSITLNSDHLYGRNGEKINIPLSINNTSAFTEIIHLSAEKSFGSFTDDQISVAPDGITETAVPFLLNKNLPEGIHEISVYLTAEEPLTSLKSDQINLSIQVVSAFGWIIKKISEFLYLLVPLCIVAILFLLVGQLLYRIFVYPKTIVQGVLCFYESGDPSRTATELKLKSFKKSTVIISMNGNKNNADYRSLTSRYNYNLIFINTFEKGKWKFIEGYKALGKHKKNSKLILKASEPGVFQYNGDIYTNKELYHGDVFETGGYTFQYLENHKISAYELGKDLLEGRI